MGSQTQTLSKGASKQACNYIVGNCVTWEESRSCGRSQVLRRSRHCPSGGGTEPLAEQQRVQRPSGGRHDGKAGEMPGGSGPPPRVRKWEGQTAFTGGVGEAHLHPSPPRSCPPSTCPLPTQGRGLWAVPGGAAPRSCPSAAGTSFCQVGGRCGGTEAHWAGPPGACRRGQPRWGELTCQPHERPPPEARL